MPTYDEAFEEYLPERSRDTKIDEAKDVLMAEYFDGTLVYYSRQLEVAIEDRFFHWITACALNELAGQGRIRSVQKEIGHLRARFYWPLRHRYPRRQMVSLFESPRSSYRACASDGRFPRVIPGHQRRRTARRRQAWVQALAFRLTLSESRTSRRRWE
jgi:hypothetical protein